MSPFALSLSARVAPADPGRLALQLTYDRPAAADRGAVLAVLTVDVPADELADTLEALLADTLAALPAGLAALFEDHEDEDDEPADVDPADGVRWPTVVEAGAVRAGLLPTFAAARAMTGGLTLHEATELRRAWAADGFPPAADLPAMRRLLTAGNVLCIARDLGLVDDADLAAYWPAGAVPPRRTDLPEEARP